MFRNSAYCLKRRFRINRLFEQPVVSQTSLLPRGFEGEALGSPIVL